MNWPDALRDSVVERFPLSRATTFRIGGPAAHAVAPRTPAEVAAAVVATRDAGIPLRAVGMGSNLLVADEGLGGLVLLMRSLAGVRFDGPLAFVGAGVSNASILRITRGRGLGGLQCLVGYPGTMGGAVRMNAGGTPGYIADRVEWVRGVDRNGAVVTRAGSECGFRYRGSDLGDLMVTEVCLRLAAGVDPEEHGLECRAIYDRKRRTQPLHLPSAGCIWKNPSRVLAGGRSAGHLVEEAGCKGLRRGGAEVSPLHGNFIVNRGGATCADVLGLAEEVRHRVADATGVALEREVVVWSDAAAPVSDR